MTPGTRPGVNCAEVSNPKHNNSIVWYWLIYDGTESIEGGCSWYLVVLGQ